MPTAILVSESALPDVMDTRSDEAMLHKLMEDHGAPMLSTAAEAADWLASFPYPSGWYQDTIDATARLQRDLTTPTMVSSELAAIRSELGASRAVFAAALGFGGSANTRHKQIWEMENARKPILPERARAARTLLALHRLDAL